MVEALHLGSLLPAAVGTCCVIGDRRARSAVAWLPPLVMLAAMLDVAFGWRVVHPLAWALALGVLSVWPAVAHRLSKGAVGADMAVHRSLGLLIMAGLLAGMGHVGAVTGHHSANLGWAGPVVVVGYLGFTLWLVAHLSRRPQRGGSALAVVESVSMALSVALMAGALA